MGLKEMREESGMSQKEAAAHFGFVYRTYQNYENGVTSPTMADAARLARFFNCTIGDLFDLEEGVKPSLTPDESHLVDTYRQLDPPGQHAVMTLAEGLARGDG